MTIGTAKEFFASLQLTAHEFEIAAGLAAGRRKRVVARGLGLPLRIGRPGLVSLARAQPIGLEMPLPALLMWFLGETELLERLEMLVGL